MCGIVGAIAQRDVGEILLEGLKRLEYRGYDSAGMAIFNHQQMIKTLRVKGKVAKLNSLYANNVVSGSLGIAHTRWATHGKPSVRNAHPHCSNDFIALVHNGIIENYLEIKQNLITQNYEFASETDTEVIAHLLHEKLNSSSDLLTAMQNTVAQLKGAYALGVISKSDPDRLIAVRYGSPLVIGIGIGENFIASDTLALLPVTQKFIFLKDGDIADIRRDQITIYDKNGQVVKRKIFTSNMTSDNVQLGEYRHYMLKEIFEQPEALQKTLSGCINHNRILPEAFGTDAAKVFAKTRQVQIVACGTSYHAALVASYWIEELANIPCRVKIASEFRYRHISVMPNTLFVTISQSGETADTLAALHKAKDMGYLATLAICNVPESALVRESDLVFLTRAGREIGVASTKAFTAQLLALLLLAVTLAQDKIVPSRLEYLLHLLQTLPQAICHALELNGKVEHLADFFVNKQHALFLGRGIEYPIAKEGALKLKEISYVHAESYPAGELKHGPLALVDDRMPVIAVAPTDDLLEKLKSNLEEVRARGGQLIVFTDHDSGIKNTEDIISLKIEMVDAIIAPIVFTVPLQLLAYHVAVIKGTDVDHPRNLAKSVTVE
ncbi:MAG: glutamine--fructose-6-phosphate transaminase (isomerizing) [Gammaproteobacteria bacterium]|jgi:glucosamine--fructose-6-phosphate aminotransferase (isomerizing)